MALSFHRDLRPCGFAQRIGTIGGSLRDEEWLLFEGLTLYFLPPYSPELNRIEKLWHKMKYECVAFKARDTKSLEVMSM